MQQLPAIPLDYESKRRPVKANRRLIVSITSLLMASTFTLWLVERPRDISMIEEPYDGRFVQRDASGNIIQETIWHQGKLISAWEATRPSHWIDDRLVFDPPRWTQVVEGGNGFITYFDDQGQQYGFASYIRGNYIGGGH